MGEIDFVTALGRLLKDARLREAFREDSARTVEALNVRATDRRTVLQLVPDEVEFQAGILLKKRLSTIRRWTPITCDRLGERLWATFVDYSNTLSSLGDATKDAYCFAKYVAVAAPAAMCCSEMDRLRFATGRARFCMRFTRNLGASMLGGRALQIFVRWSDSGWKEWRVGMRAYAARENDKRLKTV